MQFRSKKARAGDSADEQGRPLTVVPKQTIDFNEEIDATPIAASALSGLKGELWDIQQVQDFLVTEVIDVLKRRRVPPDQVQPPRMDIAVPAIDIMRYSSQRDEIANLIACSMDSERAHEAHPSFIDVITQLTADELNMLRTFPMEGRVLPMAHIHKLEGRTQISSSFRNIVPPSLAKVCRERRAIPTYIDNLARLNILYFADDITIRDARVYDPILTQSFVKKRLGNRSFRNSHRVQRSALGITSFGTAFRRACLD